MSSTQNGAADLINQLLGITADSPLAEVRNRRPEVVAHSQGSYRSHLSTRRSGRPCGR
ncbi:MAG: hypothetical protein R2932_10255 [Caldilineaceae bacterium]